ncbi:MAG TPA: GNAT family N-acetyltransferase [Demequinaceae bacterium]
MIGPVIAPSGYRLVDLPRERGQEMLDIDSWAFVFAVRPSEVEAVLDAFPFDRARGIEIVDPARGTPGTLAAVHSSFEFATRVPGGGTVPTAGLTWVGVHQGHRRRGLLTAMITDHFARSRARGEVVSTLFAAEPGIYQRFGYGLAARDLRMKLGRKPELRDVSGSDDLTVTLESSSLEAHGPVVRAFQASQLRPGTNTVVPDSLLTSLVVDVESNREGAEPLRFATVRDGETVVAWATFRRKGDWEGSEPNGIVKVIAWGAMTAAATRRLWSVLTDLDLMTSTRSWAMAVDDPLVHLLVDERAAKPDVRDNVWVRILDVKGAIEGRRYESDADVVLRIADVQVPENAGLWRVTIADGAAHVSPDAGSSADLTLGIQELGAAYLGGVGVEALVQASLVVENTPGAAKALGRAMLSALAPVSNFMF